MISVTYWEAEALLEHAQSRPDIWIQSEENPWLWLRTNGDGVDLCAILIVPPIDESNPYRRYGVEVIPQVFEEADARAYVFDLLKHWTTYGHRMDVQKLLTDEVKMDSPLADAVAVAVESFDWITPRIDPETIVDDTIIKTLTKDPGILDLVYNEFIDVEDVVGVIYVAGVESGRFQVRKDQWEAFQTSVRALGVSCIWRFN